MSQRTGLAATRSLEGYTSVNVDVAKSTAANGTVRSVGICCQHSVATSGRSCAEREEQHCHYLPDTVPDVHVNDSLPTIVLRMLNYGRARHIHRLLEATATAVRRVRMCTHTVQQMGTHSDVSHVSAMHSHAGASSNVERSDIRYEDVYW
jgi:hypothetical protein